jgi:hypothetical protein
VALMTCPVHGVYLVSPPDSFSCCVELMAKMEIPVGMNRVIGRAETRARLQIHAKVERKLQLSGHARQLTIPNHAVSIQHLTVVLVATLMMSRKVGKTVDAKSAPVAAVRYFRRLTFILRILSWFLTGSVSGGPARGEESSMSRVEYLIADFAIAPAPAAIRQSCFLQRGITRKLKK